MVMKNIAKKLKNIRGISLVEVLIGLFISGLVTAAVFEAYISQHKSWNIQEDVTEIQQNARAAIDELTRNIRMAGDGLPTGFPPVEAFDTNPDTIIINYVTDGCAANISEDMPLPSSELKCVGSDVSCFNDGQWVFIYDPDSTYGEYFITTSVQSGSQHIQHNTMSLSRTYQEGAFLMALQRVKYFIDNSDTAHPNLMIQLPGNTPQVYAENIADFQLKYKMNNGVIEDVPNFPEDVREIEITIVGRSDRPDPDFPQDPYRHRTYASKVNLRNLDH
jgi:hypothetical protein